MQHIQSAARVGTFQLSLRTAVRCKWQQMAPVGQSLSPEAEDEFADYLSQMMENKFHTVVEMTRGHNIPVIPAILVQEAWEVEVRSTGRDTVFESPCSWMTIDEEDPGEEQSFSPRPQSPEDAPAGPPPPDDPAPVPPVVQRPPPPQHPAPARPPPPQERAPLPPVLVRVPLRALQPRVVLRRLSQSPAPQSPPPQPAPLPQRPARRKACGICQPCRRVRCGVCPPCTNPRLKKVCVQRRCETLYPPPSADDGDDGGPAPHRRKRRKRCDNCPACDSQECGGSCGHCVQPRLKRCCVRRQCPFLA